MDRQFIDALLPANFFLQTLDCVFGRKLLNKTKDNFGKIILFIVLPVQGGHIRNAVKYWGDVLEGGRSVFLRCSGQTYFCRCSHTVCQGG